MRSTPATCPGFRTSRSYRARPSASRIEPVLLIMRSVAAPPVARHANNRGTRELAASTFAAGRKNWPARPCSGNSAALTPASTRSSSSLSMHMRASTAAPAEWPSAHSGRTPSDRCNRSSSCDSDAAMPGSDRSASAGVPVNPWPGKSGAITVKCSASSGDSERHEWLAAPVPCSSRIVGRPGDGSPSTCTCQRSPPHSMKRLAARFGQSAPSVSQSSAARATVMGRGPDGDAPPPFRSPPPA